jgi:membrane-associated phospholipid phosphatase
VAVTYLRAATAFVVAYALLALVVAQGWLRPVDLGLAKAARFDSPCWLLNIGEAASVVLAGEVSLVYIGALALLCVWRRQPLSGAWLIGLMLVAVTLEFAFKFWFYQPAPQAFLGDLERLDCYRPTYLDYPLAAVDAPNTFPSGYATRGAYLGVLGAALVGACWPSKATSARLALMALIVLLSATRVPIAWHWSSDVLGGLLLGTAAACLALALVDGFRWLKGGRADEAKRRVRESANG